jgi:tRNA nucleotidyltransferase (CCA-adding enzyme)
LRIVYMLAVLTHDVGKATTTQEVVRNGLRRIISPGHDAVGVGLAREFLEGIGAPNSIIERVLPLVFNHMAHLHGGEISDRSVRRLARRLSPASIQDLIVIMTADHMGRPPKPAVAPLAAKVLKKKAEELELHSAAPKPLVLGRHLLELGLAPGPAFGKILEAAFEAQLDGEFSDLTGGLKWLKEKEQL